MEPWSATQISPRAATTVIPSALQHGIQVNFQTTTTWLLAVSLHLIQLLTAYALEERPRG